MDWFNTIRSISTFLFFIAIFATIYFVFNNLLVSPEDELTEFSISDKIITYPRHDLSNSLYKY